METEKVEPDSGKRVFKYVESDIFAPRNRTYVNLRARVIRIAALVVNDTVDKGVALSVRVMNL